MTDDQRLRSLAWAHPEHVGEPELQRGIASAAAPLLAGFSLAAVALLLTEKDTPPLADWSVLAFVCAASALVYAMQFDFHALKHGAPPSARLEALPEATTDQRLLNRLRRMQAMDLLLAEHYGRWGRIAYNLGLHAFLAGLLLLTYPRDWTLAATAAFVVACIGLLGEAVWTIRGHGLKGLSPPWQWSAPWRWRPFVLDYSDVSDQVMVNLDDELDHRTAEAVMKPSSARGDDLPS